jgi:AcrR family transcriptional regulator
MLARSHPPWQFRRATLSDGRIERAIRVVYVKASERRGQLVSAARAVLVRDGIASTTLRSVAAEAGVPLGTLHYVFASKELLIRAVIEDVRDEVSAVLTGVAQNHAGLEGAIRQGLKAFWEQQIVGDPRQPLMRQELFLYAVRTPGLEGLARWQVEGYGLIVAAWCQDAADNAGELCAVPFDMLARVLVGGVMGIALQYLGDQDRARSLQDVEVLAEMAVRLAAVRPTSRSAGG